MPRKLKVFVSSCMNTRIDDLSRERKAVIERIEDLEYFEPWAFEHEPASSKNVEEHYLSSVRESDIFLLIVRRVITRAVKRER